MKMNSIKVWLLILTLPVWAYAIYKWPDFRLFSVFIPLAMGVNLSSSRTARGVFISLLVVCWLALFQYESLRTFYFNQVLKKDFPKTKFLFPPAGWIMFYKVGKSAGNIEVYGVKGKQSQLIDPHDIFRTRTIGYDNIHRGIMGSASDSNPRKAVQFCKFLNYRFPYFDKFYVSGFYYPNLVESPYERRQRILYECDDKQIKFNK